MDQAAEAVKNAIMNGIDLIREGAGLDITSATFIIQICATLVLFLIVRFKCWNIVTNFLEKRNQSVKAALNEKTEAEKEVKALQFESAHLLEDNHPTGRSDSRLCAARCNTHTIRSQTTPQSAIPPAHRAP